MGYEQKSPALDEAPKGLILNTVQGSV